MVQLSTKTTKHNVIILKIEIKKLEYIIKDEVIYVWMIKSWINIRILLLVTRYQLMIINIYFYICFVVIAIRIIYIRLYNNHDNTLLMLELSLKIASRLAIAIIIISIQWKF